MDTEELVETFIDEGCRAYKHNSKGSPEALKLDRHETVTVDGIDFNYWREYTVYRMAQYIREVIPEVSIDVTLDGNDSTIALSDMSNEAQQKLNRTLYNFMEKLK